MAILSFWSESKKETGQTLSIAALATYMSVEHNYKTLIVNAALDDDTLERCFWDPDANKVLKQELNKGKMDIAVGTEGLISAIASNKTSPEIIANYTKVVFKNRLDVLVGLKTPVLEEHEKTLLMYPDMLKAANKFYDLVIVDLPKTLDRQSTSDILKISDVVMYTMAQNLKQINQYKEDRYNIPELKNVIPILGSENNYSKYNQKNVASAIKDKELASIRYNNVFLEAASEASVAKFFLQTRLKRNLRDKNSEFLQSVANSSEKIMHKFQEIKYGRVLDSDKKGGNS